MSSNSTQPPNNEISISDIFDSLLMESFLNRRQHNPPDLNAGSVMDDVLSTVLTPSLPLIPSLPSGLDEISSSTNGPDEPGLGYVANEEAKVEAEIIRTIHSGNTESLQPNSGQPVTIGGHNISVGFHDEMGSEYRVWEWHGHVLTPNEDNCYSLEYIFGNYFEKRR